MVGRRILQVRSFSRSWGVAGDAVLLFLAQICPLRRCASAKEPGTFRRTCCNELITLNGPHCVWQGWCPANVRLCHVAVLYQLRRAPRASYMLLQVLVRGHLCGVVCLQGRGLGGVGSLLCLREQLPSPAALCPRMGWGRRGRREGKQQKMLEGEGSRRRDASGTF